MRKFVLLALLCGGTDLAASQQVIQASAELQPLVYRDGAGYKGCGIRAMILAPAAGGSMHGADLSMNLFSSGNGPVGIVKVAYVRAEPPDKFQLKVPKGFSLGTQAAGKKVTLANAGDSTDDPQYMIAGTTAPEIVALLTDLLDGKAAVLGVGDERADREKVFVFKGALGADDSETFHACLAGLLQRI